MARRSERGFALVAAITAAAALSYIAFEVLAADRGETAGVAGQVAQARLAAAADAGVALALHGLGTQDRAARWSLDGRVRHIDFDGFDLAVVVQDERGKAPLAGLTDSQARALFEGAGAAGDRLDALVDEFRDWQADVDEQADQALGPAARELSAPGLQARHGAFRSVGELMALRDMDSSLFSRIAPAVTVFFGESGPFEPKNASPLAIAAMSGLGGDSPQDIAVDTASSNEQPVEEIAEADDDLIGRTLTVNVVARDRAGRRTHRTAIVELTGSKAQPYWVRYVE